MKLDPTDKSNRTRLATGLPTPHRNDPASLEITICYTGASSAANAIPLDSHVIPQIVRAVNCHDELLAACEDYIRYRQGNDLSIDDIAARMKSAIAKATANPV